jgi:glutathione synthase/RimK-type ligase-like ATP-grasp enzyme
MKIALLTCQNWPNAKEKEQALAKEINPKIEVDVTVWNDTSVNWGQYDYLIFRSIWDYFEFPTEFNDWLNKIERLNIKTLNPLEVVRQNQHKFYLQTLQQQGFDIIPTVFVPKNTDLNLGVLKQNNWPKAVIKPAISAGSYLTKLFGVNEIEAVTTEYTPIVAERDLLLQPFMPEIQTQGEISMLFYGGHYSHAILKKPVNNDFRVQVQFGGVCEPYQAENEVIEVAKKIIATFGQALLYARVDGIMKDGRFLLMEVELIEPDLFFDYHPEAKKRYFAALERMVGL